MTVDAQLPYQQYISALALGVIVLRGRTTRHEDLLELVPQLRKALSTIRPGELATLSWRDA